MHQRQGLQALVPDLMDKRGAFTPGGSAAVVGGGAFTPGGGSAVVGVRSPGPSLRVPTLMPSAHVCPGNPSIPNLTDKVGFFHQIP